MSRSTPAPARLSGEAATLKVQVGEAEHRLVIRQMRARLRLCQRHIAALEVEIRAIIAKDPALAERYAILCSIPCIGPVVASVLVAQMPELGAVTAGQVAALAGVAPVSRESGLWKGRRMIRGGRQNVRNALYPGSSPGQVMASLSAIGCNPPLAAFCRRLIGKGKPAKLALTAVMRKLVILANTLIKQGREWQPKCP